MELFEACRTLIVENYEGQLDEKVLEVLTIAVMALVLRNEKLTLERLPGILKNIAVYAENKSVLDIAHEKINNFNDDAVHKRIGACVERKIRIDNETDAIVENKYLLVSLLMIDSNPTDVIEKITHELTHLLRCGNVSFNGNSITVKNGISIVRIPDIETGVKKAKHFYFEEGIVQRYTLQALDALYEFVKQESLPPESILSCFKRDYPKGLSNPYEIQTRLLDDLCKDPNYEELFDKSFYDEETPSQMASYFNRKVNSATAFTSLSKYTDACFEHIIKGDKEAAKSDYINIMKQVMTFQKCSSVKKY